MSSGGWKADFLLLCRFCLITPRRLCYIKRLNREVTWMYRMSKVARILQHSNSENRMHLCENRDPPTAQGAVISIAAGWRQVRFGNIAMKRKRGAQKCRRESRPADGARRRHIHCWRNGGRFDSATPSRKERRSHFCATFFLFGGGGGNRTRVRKAFDRTFSGCRAPTEFPRSCRRCAGCMIG